MIEDLKDIQPVEPPVKRRPGRPAWKHKVSAPGTDTPEFKAAVAKAAAEALKELLPSLQEARKEHGSEESGSDATWMRALAMEISQLTDQGTGRKRVAPELIASREQSREKMTQLIIEARAQGKVATYRVKAKVYLADRVVEPFWIASDHSAQPTIIDWDGIPNEAMAPENKTAKAIYDAYKGWVGSSARVVPEDALAITPNGLVVHGGAAGLSSGKRQVAAGDKEADHTGKPGDEPGLRIHHKNEPGRYVEKHILGSIAQPARQTV